MFPKKTYRGQRHMKRCSNFQSSEKSTSKYSGMTVENRMEVSQKTKIRTTLEFPVMAQWLTNMTRNHEVAGSTPGLAQ